GPSVRSCPGAGRQPLARHSRVEVRNGFVAIAHPVALNHRPGQPALIFRSKPDQGPYAEIGQPPQVSVAYGPTAPRDHTIVDPAEVQLHCAVFCLGHFGRCPSRLRRISATAARALMANAASGLALCVRTLYGWMKFLKS